MDSLMFVDFHEYCPKCIHADDHEWEEPCNSCLTIPARETVEPEYFKESKVRSNKDVVCKKR